MNFDWAGLGVIFLRLFALSLIVQLALESLYRWTGFTVIEEAAKAKLRGIGLRFPVAFAFSLWIVRERHYDALAELFSSPEGWSGSLVTALAVTGGTAPFLALFSKIEEMRERSKLLITKSQAARASVTRVEDARVAEAKVDAAEARIDIAQAEAVATVVEKEVRDGGT